METRGRSVAAADRRIRAVELRIGGSTYKEIGEALGVSHNQAHKDVMAALKERSEQLIGKAAELTALEDAKLDELDADLARIQRRGNGNDEEPLTPMQVAGVIDQRRKVSESKRRLHGLDAPAKTAFTDPTGAEAATPVVVYLPDNGRDGAARDDAKS